MKINLLTVFLGALALLPVAQASPSKALTLTDFFHETYAKNHVYYRVEKHRDFLKEIKTLEIDWSKDLPLFKAAADDLGAEAVNAACDERDRLKEIVSRKGYTWKEIQRYNELGPIIDEKNKLADEAKAQRGSDRAPRRTFFYCLSTDLSCPEIKISHFFPSEKPPTLPRDFSIYLAVALGHDFFRSTPKITFFNSNFSVFSSCHSDMVKDLTGCEWYLVDGKVRYPRNERPKTITQEEYFLETLKESSCTHFTLDTLSDQSVFNQAFIPKILCQFAPSKLQSLTLSHLDLQSSPFLVQTFEELARLKLSHELNLSHNALTFEEGGRPADILQEILGRPGSACIVNLNGNAIDDKGLALIHKALAKRCEEEKAADQSSRFSRLSLIGNPCLQEEGAHFTALKTLSKSHGFEVITE